MDTPEWFNEKTFYEIFGIEDEHIRLDAGSSGLRHIRQRYHEMLLRFHPDKAQQSGIPLTDATEITKIITEAYETLTSEDSRRSYDAELALSRLPSMEGLSLGNSSDRESLLGEDESAHDGEQQENNRGGRGRGRGRARGRGAQESRGSVMKRKKQNPDANRVTSFCFTLFLERFVSAGSPDKRNTFENETVDEFIEMFIEKATKNQRISFCIFQLERTKKGKLLHFQGYVDLRERVRMPNQIKRVVFAELDSLGENGLLCRSVHIEKRRGTQAEAVDYCRKTASREPGNSGPWEIGIISRIHQGIRADIQEFTMSVQDAVSKGENPYEHALYGEHVPFASRSMTYVDRLVSHTMQLYYRELVRFPVDTVCISGPTNIGKSFFVERLRRSLMDKKNTGIYTFDVESGNRGAYWMNYTPSYHKIVVIDECIENIDPVYLLRLIDPGGYPMQLNVKFTSSWAGYFLVIILSNKLPEEWFSENTKFTDEQRLALRRRILHVERPDSREALAEWKIPLSPANIDRLNLPSSLVEPFLAPFNFH